MNPKAKLKTFHEKILNSDLCVHIFRSALQQHCDLFAQKGRHLNRQFFVILRLLAKADTKEAKNFLFKVVVENRGVYSQIIEVCKFAWRNNGRCKADKLDFEAF